MLHFLYYRFLVGKFYYLYYHYGEIQTRDCELNTVSDPHKTFWAFILNPTSLRCSDRIFSKCLQMWYEKIPFWISLEQF